MNDTREDTPDEALLREMLARSVRNPGDIMLSTAVSGRATSVINIEVHPDDYGLVFGRQGKRLDALRRIMAFIGAAQGRRIMLIFVETPMPGYRREFLRFSSDPAWRPDATVALLRKVLKRVLKNSFEVNVLDVPNSETTMIDVEAEDSGDILVLAQIMPHVRTVFHAIGMNEGRVIEFPAVHTVGATT